jgi:hypothetical protein
MFQLDDAIKIFFGIHGHGEKRLTIDMVQARKRMTRPIQPPSLRAAGNPRVPVPAMTHTTLK